MDTPNTPHDRAMDRCEAARAALKLAKAEADRLVKAAEREVGEAMAELMRYEKQPGIPLAVDKQFQVEKRYAEFKAKFGGEQEE